MQKRIGRRKENENEEYRIFCLINKKFVIINQLKN